MTQNYQSSEYPRGSLADNTLSPISEGLENRETRESSCTLRHVVTGIAQEIKKVWCWRNGRMWVDNVGRGNSQWVGKSHPLFSRLILIEAIYTWPSTQRQHEGTDNVLICKNHWTVEFNETFQSTCRRRIELSLKRLLVTSKYGTIRRTREANPNEIMAIIWYGSKR
jgi:hypothetical protein